MRALGLVVAGALCAGCMGTNQLSGSVDALFPLQVSWVDVRRNEEALQVSYMANHGPAVDLVAQVTVVLTDLTIENGVAIRLEGEYQPGHKRTTIVHAAVGEPFRVLAPVKAGELVLDQGGNPGEMTRGRFGMSFVTGDGYGAGRTLDGTFAAVAADAGFGP